MSYQTEPVFKDVSFTCRLLPVQSSGDSHAHLLYNPRSPFLLLLLVSFNKDICVVSVCVTGGQAQGQEKRDTMMDTVHQLDQNDGFITFLNKTLQYGADPNNWGHKF